MEEQIKKIAIKKLNEFIELKETKTGCEIRMIDLIFDYEEYEDIKSITIKFHTVSEHEIFRGRLYYNHTKQFIDFEYLKMY